jgi:hypothetical protein
MDIEQADEAERYLQEQLRSEEQRRFRDARTKGETYIMPEHDHMFPYHGGECMWPVCTVTGSDCAPDCGCGRTGGVETVEIQDADGRRFAIKPA